MDIAMLSMQNSLRSVQQAVSMTTLKKVMSQDAQAMTQLIADLRQANPAPVVYGVGARLNVQV